MVVIGEILGALAIGFVAGLIIFFSIHSAANVILNIPNVIIGLLIGVPAVVVSLCAKLVKFLLK